MPAESDRSHRQTQFLIRLAGLPAAALEPFGSPDSLRELARLGEIESLLQEARSEMVRLLHAAVPRASPEVRRFLLKVKRDCYNGRRLDRHRRSPLFPEIRRRTGELAGRLCELEGQWAAAAASFEAVVRSEQERELEALRELAGDPRLAEGLAVASPVLASRVPAFRRRPARDRRKERQAARSLLRYASRAVLKLSPFATLTRLSAGSLVPEVTAEPNGLALRTGVSACTSHRLMRLRSYLVEQLAALVCLHPPLRRTLPVRIAPHLGRSRDGRYRFVRLPRWQPGEGGEMRRVKLALVEAKLDTSVVDWLRERLEGERELSYTQLARGLAGATDEDVPAAEAVVDRLLAAGVLVLSPPWGRSGRPLERELLEWTEQHRGPALDPLCHALAELLGLERGPDVGSLARVRGIQARLDRAWEAAVALVPPGPPRPHLHRLKENEVYEDVFLTPEDPETSLMEVSESAIREAFRAAAPLHRLLDFARPRYDFLETLLAVARRRWPGGREVELLDLYDEMRPLWRGYRAYLRQEGQRDPAERKPFNPLSLAEVEELHGLRVKLWRGLPEAIERGPEVDRLIEERLRALLAGVPQRYAPACGPCLLLQPVSGGGQRWVLNRLFEGTGRYSSRFTPVMPPALRHHWVRRLIACGKVEIGGRRLELLDLFHPEGDTLNVHYPQTPRTLDLRGGGNGDGPGPREIGLGELRVRVEGHRGFPEVIDPGGNALLPVHLGGAALRFQPALLAFLAEIGPGELVPRKLPRDAGQGAAPAESLQRRRLCLGPLVLERRRWAAPVEPLVEVSRTAASPGDFFAAVQRWRERYGLPAQGYLLERVRHPVAGRATKPQYLDLTSPLFLDLLETVVRDHPGPELVIEEALPAPADFPADGEGDCWAVELLLEAVTVSDCGEIW